MMFKESGTPDLETRNTIRQAANTRNLSTNLGGAYQATLGPFYQNDHERNLIQSVRQPKLDISAREFPRQLQDSFTTMTMDKIVYNPASNQNSKSEPQPGGKPSRQPWDHFKRRTMSEIEYNLAGRQNSKSEPQPGESLPDNLGTALPERP